MVSFSVAFFFCFLILARSWASRVWSTTNGGEATAKGRGAFFLASVLASVLASGATFAQPSTFAPSGGARGIGDENVGGNLGTNAGVNAGGSGRTASRRFDPLRRDALGVQTRYPAVAKIVGRDAPQTREDGSQTIPLYYGTGTFVAEAGEWGIVVTNWHVVSESRDSIVAKFPTFSSPARAILRDETWDLAALVVRKPPRVAPIPISQEAPNVGDALWVAGYGESAGLTEFQIQGGRVQNYALLVTEDGERENAAASDGRETVGPSERTGQNERNGQVGQPGRAPTNGAISASAAKTTTLTPESALLYETLAVDKGVRKGDSGGPIFNRYGELAGVLWGSNGESTMGTYCLRVQYFLTQAIERLAILEAERLLSASTTDFLAERPEAGLADAKGSELWARAALAESGVFPISQRPAYVAADGRETPENLRRVGVKAANKRVKTALSVAENATATALPPSPPVFSPTFVKQQGVLNRVRPEVAESGFWTNLVDAKRGALVARRTEEAKVRETSVVAAATVSPADVAAASVAENATNADFADEPSARLPQGRSKGPGDALTSERSAPSVGDETTVALLKPVVLDGDKTQAAEGGAAQDESANRENRENKGNGGEADDAEKTESREDGEKTENSENDEDLAKKAEAGEPVKSGDSAEPKDDAEKKSWEKRVNLNGFYLNDIQVYLIICAIFCLFYNAARLMTDVELKKTEIKKECRKPLKEGKRRARRVEGRDA